MKNPVTNLVTNQTGKILCMQNAYSIYTAPTSYCFTFIHDVIQLNVSLSRIMVKNDNS